ncbi:hypothetical protein DIE19_35250 [Burkholderia sp. Bp9126]|nr:hypothetical protein DIE19_35250 [Burkholderia sp. Bp9126]
MRTIDTGFVEVKSHRGAQAMWILAAAVCGVLACVATLMATDRWPAHFPSANVTMGRASEGVNVAVPQLGAQRQAAGASPASNGSGGSDALELVNARAAVAPSMPDQSSTLVEALQRALTYPASSALAKRSDPEGRFAAAAWAIACTQHNLKHNAIRCEDANLRDPHYALNLQRVVSGADPRDAIVELALKYRMRGNSIARPAGLTLADHRYAMAAHGDVRALVWFAQSCSVPGACSDAVFTRDVLISQAYQFARSARPAGYIGQLQGGDAPRRLAITRGTTLRRSLHGQQGALDDPACQNLPREVQL